MPPTFRLGDGEARVLNIGASLRMGGLLCVDGEYMGKIEGVEQTGAKIVFFLTKKGQKGELEFEDVIKADGFMSMVKKPKGSDAHGGSPGLASAGKPQRGPSPAAKRQNPPPRQTGLSKKSGAGKMSSDPFCAFNRSTLSSVGGFAAGATIQHTSTRSEAPTSGEPRAGRSGSSGGSAANANSDRLDAWETTPEAGSRRAASLNEEQAEKRRRIDAECQSPTFRGGYTPMKSRPGFHRMREPRAHSSSVIYFTGVRKQLAATSSSSYSGYRSTETFGLRNLGNTCYLNAVMQACGSLREFVKDLTGMPGLIPSSGEGKLFRCAVDILQQLGGGSHTPRGPLSPGKLREQIAVASPMFGRNEQQDAHEFFLEYVNQLHDELLGARTRWLAEGGGLPGGDAELAAAEQNFALATQLHLDSVVDKRLECVACRESRTIHERFRDFSIDFQQGDDCPLAGMLRAYFAPEEVEAKCQHCGSNAACLEKSLVAPPRVLALHLKRFVPNIEKRRYDKRHQSVFFPQRLDLESCLRPRLPARPLAQASGHGDDAEGGSKDAAAPPLWYSLRALVSHDGASPHSGHYVCYARGDKGDWKLYDDSIVKELGSDFEPHRRLGRSAYILFYVMEENR